MDVRLAEVAVRRAPRHVVVVGDGRRACVERLDTPAPRAPAVSPRRDAPRHSDYPRRGRGVLTAEYPRRGICRHDPSTEYIRVAARLGSPPPRAPAETERPRRGRGRDPSTDYSGPSRGVAAILPRTIQAPSAASPRLVHGLFKPQPRRRRDSSTDNPRGRRGVDATRWVASNGNRSVSADVDATRRTLGIVHTITPVDGNGMEANGLSVGSGVGTGHEMFVHTRI